MSRPEFENQVSIAAVTNKKIKFTKKESVTALAPNTYDRHTFFSPVKTVSRVINMQMKYDKIGGTGLSGTRELILDNYLDAGTGLGIFRAASLDIYKDFVFDQGSFTHDNEMVPTNIQIRPNDLAAINANIREMRFDSSIGLTFVFLHTIPAVNATEKRSIIFFSEEEVIA